MKKLSKLVCLVLALGMLLGVAATVLADQEGSLSGGSITVNDAVSGQKYNAYQILYLESYNAESGAYAYKANSEWEAWLKSQTDYMTIDAQGYVTWVEGADPAAFAKKAQAYAKEAEIAGVGEVTAAGSVVSFTGLKLGYYLIDTTLGTLCALDTTDPNAVVDEKNEAPSNVKSVEEDSTLEYGETNDADVGQTVHFKSTVTAQPGAENYVLHDKMTEGLTFQSNSVHVTLNGNDVDEDDYSVVTDGLDDECTFEVRFTQDFCDSLTANASIVISYSATVNEGAVIAGGGNPNTSKLSYGDSSNIKYTPDSTTKTYVWDVDVFKYALNGETETPLAGAKFTIGKNSDGTGLISLINKGSNVYRVAKEGETGTITEIETDASGRFTIEGLDSDTYYLTETKAPDGHNKVADPIKVVIDENGKINATESEPNGVSEVKILNQTGAELPSTGGIGTTIFYVAGGTLIVLALVVLITKKRMDASR